MQVLAITRNELQQTRKAHDITFTETYTLIISLYLCDLQPPRYVKQFLSDGAGWSLSGGPKVHDKTALGRISGFEYCQTFQSTVVAMTLDLENSRRYRDDGRYRVKSQNAVS